ncbi:UDP-glycosyltransferase UGT5-like isoform X2 [Pectinophora gossypiella]|uniref:UDP-glycosyltransferase UGT5-like isoform X2 n=1 Tax=Pectinophora gossypiella TaxID=13191 RepID=UPI00214E66A9|nr:UDP-glycosyltransferase UGT5-like isoform X2 [Pectinophora gossypiella]
MTSDLMIKLLLVGMVDGSRPNLFTTVDMSTETILWKFLWVGGLALTENYLKSKQVQEFLAKDNTFDMVISEQFAQEAFYILAHKYNAPLGLVSTFGNCMKHNIVTRNPLQMATVTFEWAEIPEPTTFVGRLKNLYYSLYEYAYWKYWFLYEQERLMTKYIPNIPQPVPSLFEMQKNASLLLMNGHFTFDPPTAYLPNIVEIGGAHLSHSKSQLPVDLKKILDEAPHGVVYVSLGSNVKSAELPIEKKNAFIKVFGSLKETVLWKWEDDDLGPIPKNIVTRKWMPQKDVLAHPNVKVFISHGGLIGTQEATYNGVPIIGIPITGDQYNNLLLAQNIGFGRILRYHDISEETLGNNLKEVLKDDSFKNKAIEIADRFKDRPMNALDTAMFWIEYVIRNKGANYMKNPAMDLSWVAANMLDVYTFVLFVVLIIIFVAIKVVLGLINMVGIGDNRVAQKRKRS